MRLSSLLFALALPLAAAAAQRPVVPEVKIPALADTATPAGVMRLLRVISADSMEGRQIWKPGAERAAKFLAGEMGRIGLVPAGDSGFFQRIPGALQADGSVSRLASLSDLDTVPAARRRMAYNVLGLLPGKGGMADSTVLIAAHYDHVGIRPAVNGDSIANGADDDGTGVVAILEMARMFKRMPAPSRTVIFMLSTGEEIGGLGRNWYVDHPARPVNSMSANLTFEMLGRPDSVGPRRAWITGFERMNMGETFQRAGLPIFPDMRPSQSFFTRSDNITFARMGIPATSMSSFGIHRDYHGVDDEADRIDSLHYATLVNVAARAVLVLTEGPPVQWYPGGRPCPVAASGGGRGRGRGGVDPSTLTAEQRDSIRAATIAAQFPQACSTGR